MVKYFNFDKPQMLMHNCKNPFRKLVDQANVRISVVCYMQIMLLGSASKEANSQGFARKILCNLLCFYKLQYV